MKTIFCLVALLFSISFCSAQKVGIGMGTAGVNFKSGSIKNVKLIGRINPLLTDRPLKATIINGSLVVGYALLEEAAGLVYLGAGVGTATTENAGLIKENKWYVNLPAGIEFFPFSAKRLSLTAEMGPCLDIDSAADTHRFSFKGLFEFSYYLGR